MWMAPCGGSCTIFTDDFSTDQLATAYSTRSGTPAVAANVLTTTSSNLLLRCETAGTTGHGRASVVGKVDTSGATFRLCGSYTDDSNYLFAEVAINGASSTLKLWKKVATVDTQLGSTVTFTGSTGTSYTVELCWNGTTAAAAIQSLSKFATGAYSGTGNKVCIGANASGGTVTFDDLSFSKHQSDDATCTACASNCSSCTNEIPATISIAFTGWVNAAGCSCTSLNTTFVVSPLSNSGCTGVMSCPPGGSYRLHVPAACSTLTGNTEIDWSISTTGGNTQIAVTVCIERVTTTPCFDFYEFRVSLGTSPQLCSGYGTISLPLDAVNTGSSCGPSPPTLRCDPSGVTCTVIM